MNCILPQIEVIVQVRQYLNYGHKLHAVCSSEGVVRCLDLTPASVHDIHYLNDVTNSTLEEIILRPLEGLRLES